MFKIYDYVWVMENNIPSKKLIYSKTDVMSFSKTKIDIEYRVVSETCGACYEKSVMVDADNLFKTKEELIKSLLNK